MQPEEFDADTACSIKRQVSCFPSFDVAVATAGSDSAIPPRFAAGIGADDRFDLAVQHVLPVRIAPSICSHSDDSVQRLETIATCFVGPSNAMGDGLTDELTNDVVAVLEPVYELTDVRTNLLTDLNESFKSDKDFDNFRGIITATIRLRNDMKLQEGLEALVNRG